MCGGGFPAASGVRDPHAVLSAKPATAWAPCHQHWKHLATDVPTNFGHMLIKFIFFTRQRMNCVYIFVSDFPADGLTATVLSDRIREVSA